MVLATFAMGYNVLFGYTGLMSLGHAMFFAAGMYGAGLCVYYLQFGAGARWSVLRDLYVTFGYMLVLLDGGIESFDGKQSFHDRPVHCGGLGVGARLL